MSSNPAILKAGTLEYTKRSLAMLFIWLLWGDFCFTLMETVHPTVLPFLLRSLGASNLIISLYLTTLTYFFNATICPIASFMSDRYRSRWGRRIPFLILSTPFVGIFLVLTGFCREIGGYFFNQFFQQSGTSEAVVTIGVIGILVVGYQVFHMVVASVYYYLFNDTVPEQYLGRFAALFRAVGTGTGALFSFFVFRYAETNSKEIFVAFGILYFAGYLAMCIKVKEGKYPPPPKAEGSRNRVIAGVKTFFKESYCHRFYWYFYLSVTFFCASGAVAPFIVFRNLAVGLTMIQIGFLLGVSQIVTTVLLIPAGYYVDKRHPIRVGLTGMIWLLIFLPLNFVFLWDMNQSTALWLLIIITAVTMPVVIIVSAADLPLFMRLLPRSRYGQFCSAEALLRSVVMMICGVLAGLFVDFLKDYCQNTLNRPGEYYYRLTFIWSFVFMGVAIYFRVKLYRLWLKLGGDDNYLAPAFEDDEREMRNVKETTGVEEQQTPSGTKPE